MGKKKKKKKKCERRGSRKLERRKEKSFFVPQLSTTPLGSFSLLGSKEEEGFFLLVPSWKNKKASIFFSSRYITGTTEQSRVRSSLPNKKHIQVVILEGIESCLDYTAAGSLPEERRK